MKLLTTFVLLGLAALQVTSALTEKEFKIFKESGHFSITARPKARKYLFDSTGIPDHEHGVFPGPGNPNKVEAHEHTFRIPKAPKYSSTGYCVAMGAIGVAINGVPLYNPYSNRGTDAVQNERFDDCNGHPDGKDRYHYHQIPKCVYNANLGNQLVGVALDGYPIYGEIDAAGENVTSSDLDICHGRYETDEETGEQVYRYRLTRDFPYILGCYRGVPSKIGGNHCLFTSLAGDNPAAAGLWD